MNSSMMNAQRTMGFDFVNSNTLKKDSTYIVANSCKSCLERNYYYKVGKYGDYKKRIPILIRSKIHFNDGDFLYDLPQETIYYTTTDERATTIKLHSTFEQGNEYYYIICVAKHYMYEKDSIRTTRKFYQFDPPEFRLRIKNSRYEELHIPIDANDKFKNFDEEYVYIVIKDSLEGRGYVSITDTPLDSIIFQSIDPNIYPPVKETHTHKDNLKTIWLPKGKYEWTIFGVNTAIPNQFLKDTITIKEEKQHTINLSHKIGTLLLKNYMNDNYDVAIRDEHSRVSTFSLSKQSPLSLSLIDGTYICTITRTNTSISNQSIIDTITIKKGNQVSIDISQYFDNLLIINNTKDESYEVSINKNDKKYALSDFAYSSSSSPSLLIGQDYSLLIKNRNQTYSYRTDPLHLRSTYYFGKKIDDQGKADHILIKSEGGFLNKEKLDRSKPYPPGEYRLLLQKKNRQSRTKSITIPFNENNKPYVLNYDMKYNLYKPFKWGFVGIGIGCLGVGVFSLIKADCLYKDYKSATNTNDATRLHHRMKNWQTASWILGGLTVATVIPISILHVKEKNFKTLSDEIESKY